MTRSLSRLLVVAVVALWGCSAPPESVYDPQVSTALNVVRMAGLEGLSDCPVHSPAISGGAGIADAGFAAASATTPPPGIGSTAGIGMGLLSMLAAPAPRANPITQQQIYAWVPIEVAPDAVATRVALVEIVKQAFLASVDPSHELEPREGVFRPTLAPDETYPMWIRHGCPEQEDRHRKAFAPHCSGGLGVWVGPTPVGRIEDVRPVPPFIAAAKQVRGPVVIRLYPFGIFKEWWRAPDSIAALSAHLPPWVFIYQPAQGGALAVVINQGQPMAFDHP
ncbi:MAG: hypothetical protein ACM31D_15775 [Bacteroidota bacterium]